MPEININEPRFSVVEFGKKIGVGRSKAWEIVQAGQIATLKIGKQTRITESAIKEYLTSCYRPAKAVG